MKQLKQIGNIFHYYFYDLLLLFSFSATQQNLYMIHLYLNLFYEDYNAVNQRYQKQIYFLSFFF